MNSNYISTQSLYDSGAHLAHAKQYSHKYIRREPNGRGGYNYFYPMDKNYSAPGVRGKHGAVEHYTVYMKNDRTVKSDPKKSIGGETTDRYRQSDKASKIYREGQSQNAKDYQSRINQASKKHEPKVSKEYKESVEANSQKNNYFGNGSEGGMFTYDPTTGKTIRVDPKDYTVKKKNLGDYAKQTLNTISSAAGSAYDKGKKFIQGLFK